ncbi:putative bifunctional diguanylate cyclase/phosphodiesterase [Actinokineospora soli]|uniref:Bifunctional diguanylate cyclase/phosphodiesterase n=1 Tax=Actinokineospora soli TaxID=1048753 RepID=A0ABW2TQP3_9PSEU
MRRRRRGLDRALRAAGARLVALQCVGADALECTVDVLGRGLAALVPGHADRAGRCVAAVAAGLLDADRQRLLSQQEGLRMSLLSAIREAKWNLRASEARFDEVVTASASGVMITDLDGRFIRVNEAVCAILERTADELTALTLFDVVHPDYADALRSDYADLLAGRAERLKQSQQLEREDGDYARVTLTASLLRGVDGGPSHFVTVVEDGTELVLLRNELSRQALHDVLTGLPNRHFFGSHLEGAVRRAGEHGVTLFHLGLDAFGAIAHGFGRHAAEQVLVTVARRLPAFATGGMVARFGGDEFGLLRVNTADTPPVRETVAALNRALGEPIQIDAGTVAITASVGVVDRPVASSNPEDLLLAADFALRRAKSRGPGQHERYDPATDARERHTDALAASMAGARASGEVTVAYRPVAALATGEVVGHEARLRWDHPALGVLGHHRCVALAERSGLVLALGAWLLRTAVDQLRWRRTTAPVLVPLSKHQLHDEALPELVAKVLSDTRLPPTRLRIGLPAPALSAGAGLPTLTALAALGVPVVLDAFTLGDLPLVEDLPVSAVRVPPSLTRRHASPLSAALATLPALVHSAGARVIVDGVSTAAEADWWRGAGADEATGDHVGPPV